MKIIEQHSTTLHAAPVYAITRGPIDNMFFSASADHFCVLWTKQPLQQQPLAVKLEKPAYAVLFIAPFQLLVVGNSEGAFHIIDYKSKIESRLIQHHQKGIFDFAFDAADNQLLVAGGDGVLSVWSMPEVELIRSIPLCENKIRQLSIDKDNNLVAVACGDGFVRVLDLVFFNEIATISAHEEGATSVAWHPTKPVLVTGGKDAHLKCWNINDQFANVLSIPAHQFAIYSIVFDETGQYCATGSRDKTIKIWNSTSFEPLLKIGPGVEGHSHSVNKLLWIGQQLVSCGDDRKICCFDISDENG